MIVKKINLTCKDRDFVEIKEIEEKTEKNDLEIYQFLSLDKSKHVMKIYFGEISEKKARKILEEDENYETFKYYQINDSTKRTLKRNISYFENGGVLRAKDFCNRNGIEWVEYGFLFPIMVDFEDGSFEYLLGIGCDYLEEENSLLAILLENSFFDDQLENGRIVSCKWIEIEEKKVLLADKLWL